MIKSNELRIKNWVIWHEDGTYMKIGPTSFLLPDEILERCGFSCLDWDCDLSIGPNIYLKWDYAAKTVGLIVDGYYLQYFDYLHELQNIYYWLKKEELEIKELQHA